MPETKSTTPASNEEEKPGKSKPAAPAATVDETPLPMLRPSGTALPEDAFGWDAAVFDAETPDYLIPKMDHFAVSTPTYFQQLVIHDPGADVTGKLVHIQTGPQSAERRPWGSAITAPIDPFIALDEMPLPGEPVFGALVSYEQGWFEKGLALGRLLHSTCLAPGEVTKIAVTSFHRQSLGKSSEEATQDDKLESATDNASAVAETQAAVSNELKTGATSNFSLANQTQAGIAGGGLFVSGNASTANNLAMGLTSAVATAATDFKAAGAKNVSQTTVAASHAVRARRASQVRETSEDESQTGQTRVIANYNHMHAMTMMFFEVLQCFSLETRVIDAERVIYIPMQDLVFTEASVRQYSDVLRAIMVEQNLPDLVKLLDGFMVAKLDAQRKAETDARNDLDDMIATYGFTPRQLYAYPDYKNVPASLNAYVEAIAGAKAKLGQHPDDQAAKTDVANYTGARDDLFKRYTVFQTARKNLQEAMPIIGILNAHRLAFNQHMWMRMDASRVQRLVHQKVVEVEGKRLALDRLMDPKPIGVFGNFVAFRLPQLSNAESIAFAQGYITEPGRANSVSASIVLPSGGLFGEAVLGQAISAEKIDLTRFWNWQDSPIPILPPELSPMSMASRARDFSFSAVEMEKSITELIKQEAPTMESPAKLAGAIAAKVSEKMVEGQAALQAAQVGQVGAGATAVGQLNAQLQKQAQDFTISALNSQAVQTALGMAFPEAGAAGAFGGALGGGKAAGAAGGALGGGSAAAGGALGGGKVAGALGGISGGGNPVAAMSGLLGGGGKSATVLGGALSAAKPVIDAAKKGLGDALEEVVDLKGIGTLTPLP